MNQVKITNTGANFTEMRVTLRPETLGDIVLRVMTQNGVVTAMFEAENQRVKEALEASFNQLRDALQESGIKFTELTVYVRQDGEERASQFERAAQASRTRAEEVNEAAEELLEISYHNGVIDVTA
jgi:flagellar hook-length control protein FliK